MSEYTAEEYRNVLKSIYDMDAEKREKAIKHERKKFSGDKEYICHGCGATLFTQNNTDQNPVPLSVDMFCKHCGTKVYYEETKEELK